MIGTALRLGLLQEGYAVDWVQDGLAAEAAADAEPYALLILDLGLPGKDGMAVLGALRARHHDVPVLILTARDTRAERIKGLDLGADDYLVKPFDLAELCARMRAVLRRHAGRAQPVIAHGPLALDTTRRELTCRGVRTELTARELALIEALMERPRAVLSRDALEDRIYGWNEQVESNAIEVHVHNLRRKLGGEVIRTVRGQGYTLAGSS